MTPRAFSRASARAVASVLALLPAVALAKLNVVTTTQDPAAITRAIGGDRVSVKALSRGFQDPHFLEAKPSYILDVNRADLVILIGLDLEVGYLPSLLQGARNAKVQPGKPGYLDLSTTQTPLEVISVADRAQGDVHPFGNPHYWLDPENGEKIAAAIAARLTELDAAGKDVYAANLATFLKELDAKQAEWARRMEPFKGKPIVTFHRSWSYFAGRYGLDVVGYVEPKPGIPPTPPHTLALIKTMRQKDVKVVLMEVYYPTRVPSLVAQKTGAKLVSVPNSVGGNDDIETYFDLFDRITVEMEKAFGGKT